MQKATGNFRDRLSSWLGTLWEYTMSRKHRHDHDDHDEHIERRLARLERKIDALLIGLNILIVEEDEENAAKSAKLTFLDSKGKTLMPATLSVGQTATAQLHEFTGLNGSGSEIPPIGPVTYSSSDDTIATVDASTGLVTAVGPGVATITGLDSGNGLSASDIVSDTPVVAQSATLTLTVN